MRLDKDGFFRPSEVAQAAQAVLCPMLAPEWNEDRLADHFLPPSSGRSDKIGKYAALWAAHVEEGTWRSDGSSGGLASWIGAELISCDKIDGVIHARPVMRTTPTDPFFRYGISRCVEEIRAAAHSHYHVVEISEVLREVRATPGRFLFVGVPCMVKAVRRVQLVDPLIAERVHFTMALICGHLKSVNWALSLGWGAGVPPSEMRSITFRVKSESHASKAYFFSVKSSHGEGERVVNSANIVGGKFNLGAMMPNGCNYCDDVVGETADITIGDAWLPRYSFDWRGKNMLVLRNPELSALLEGAATKGRVVLESMSHAEAIDAQAGGFRQRREGLAYRQELARALGQWAPVKRNFANTARPGLFRRAIYRLRMEVSRRSSCAFAAALAAEDFMVYEKEMKSGLRWLRYAELSVSALRIIRTRVIAILSRREK
jgi:coenzyme F420-reducing hydrogenase beta subunit